MIDCEQPTAKKCKKCRCRKKLEAFPPSKVTLDGRGSWCRKCATDNQRERRHAGLVNFRSKSYRNLQLMDLIAEAKAGGCIKCGVKDPCVLDLHHRIPARKKFTIARFKKHSAYEVKIELGKCVVLCANDHRRLHAGKFSLKDLL